MLGMLKAMRTTLRHLPMKKITVQYPEQRELLPERSRGLFRVVIDPATDEPRCRSCTLCESNCPVQVIRVNSASKYQLPAPNEARLRRARLESQPKLDTKLLAPVIDDFYEHGTGLIAVLQNVQDVYGYLPRQALQDVSLVTGISLSQIYGVASFYNQFRLSPIGKFLIDVCHGTACHVAGAGLITNALEEELGIESGKTTADMMYTLSSVACMGACSQAPVMRIGEQTFGNLTPDLTRKAIRKHMAASGVAKD
jgi:NADH-quinone oxidoreductase subunit E